MLHGENHCEGSGRFQMLHIITYYLSYIIAIQLIILEKRCIKFVWSLYNSNYALYSNILRFSLQNGNSTLGENVRYLMHKYDIVSDTLYSKVEY